MENVREKLYAIVCDVNGVKSFHFTSGRLQTDGAGRELWFPVNGDLFNSIEQALVINYIAHNVTSVESIVSGSTYNDYEIIFNKVVI